MHKNCQVELFEPPFEGLRGNVCTSSSLHLIGKRLIDFMQVIIGTFSASSSGITKAEIHVSPNRRFVNWVGYFEAKCLFMFTQIFRTFWPKSGFFLNKIGKSGAILTPSEPFLLLQVITSVPILVKIDQKCDLESVVRRSGRGTVHWRPHKIFLHFHQLWTLLSKIREGVALSLLRIFYKTHLYANQLSPLSEVLFFLISL